MKWLSAGRHKFFPEDNSVLVRFARGSFWLMSGSFIAQALGMIASMVTARLLGKNGYGELGMINSTVGTFGMLAGLGLGITSTKFVAEWKNSDPNRTGRFIRTATIIALISGGSAALLAFIFAPQISAHILNAPRLSPLLRLGCLLLFFQTLTGTQMGTLSGFEAFKEITRINFIQGMLNFPFMLAGAWFFGLTGAVAATVIVGIFGWWLTWRMMSIECAKNAITPNFCIERTELFKLFNFSFPAFLSSLLVGPVLWLANTIVAKQPAGYGELGIINAASQWRIILMTLPAIFCGATLPILSEQQAKQDNQESYKQTLDLTQKVSGIVVIPLYVFIIFLGDFIMRLYGKDFSAGYPVLVGVVFGISFSAVLSIAGTAFASLGKMWLGLFLNFIWGSIFIIGLIQLAPLWGARGYAVSFALSYGILFLLAYHYLTNILLKITLKRIRISALFLLLITALCLCLTPAARLYVSIPAVCFSALLAIQLSGKDSIKKIIKRVCEV